MKRECESIQTVGAQEHTYIAGNETRAQQENKQTRFCERLQTMAGSKESESDVEVRASAIWRTMVCLVVGLQREEESESEEEEEEGDINTRAGGGATCATGKTKKAHTIVMERSETFCVPMSLLTANSPVFAAMLKGVRVCVSVRVRVCVYAHAQSALAFELCAYTHTLTLYSKGTCPTETQARTHRT